MPVLPLHNKDLLPFDKNTAKERSQAKPSGYTPHAECCIGGRYHFSPYKEWGHISKILVDYISIFFRKALTGSCKLTLYAAVNSKICIR